MSNNAVQPLVPGVLILQSAKHRQQSVRGMNSRLYRFMFTKYL